MGDLGIISAVRLVRMVRRLGPVRHASIMGELALDDRGANRFSSFSSVCS